MLIYIYAFMRLTFSGTVLYYPRTRWNGRRVLRRWNKRRPPTVDEMDLYDRWIDALGFDAETILAAAARMTTLSASPRTAGRIHTPRA